MNCAISPAVIPKSVEEVKSLAIEQYFPCAVSCLYCDCNFGVWMKYISVFIQMNAAEQCSKLW